VTVKCRTAIKALFLCFYLCLCLMLDSLPCLFSSIFFLTNSCFCYWKQQQNKGKGETNQIPHYKKSYVYKHNGMLTVWQYNKVTQKQKQIYNEMECYLRIHQENRWPNFTCTGEMKVVIVIWNNNLFLFIIKIHWNKMKTNTNLSE